MNTLYLKSEAISVEFDRAKRAADAVAHALLGENLVRVVVAREAWSGRIQRQRQVEQPLL